jgi:hypothetical protein
MPPSASFQRFKETFLDPYDAYMAWHDGFSLDFDALAKLAGDERLEAVRLLTEKLGERDPRAPEGLGALGRDATSALPVLRETIKGPMDLCTIRAGEALWKIAEDPIGPEAIGVMVRAGYDAITATMVLTDLVLRKDGPAVAAKTVAPWLRAGLDSTLDLVRHWSAVSLLKIAGFTPAGDLEFDCMSDDPKRVAKGREAVVAKCAALFS